MLLFYLVTADEQVVAYAFTSLRWEMDNNVHVTNWENEYNPFVILSVKLWFDNAIEDNIANPE